MENAGLGRVKKIILKFKISAKQEGPGRGNMVVSAKAYGNYTEEVLAKQIDAFVLAEVIDLDAKKDFNKPL